MFSIQQFRHALEQRKGQRDLITQQINQTKQSAREHQRNLRRHEEAREIIREVGLRTQQQLEYHISEITTLALEAVFDNPYELKVEFVQRRNKTECDLFFQRDGNRFDPIDSSGVGTIDVAAFALRVASWSMQQPRSRSTLILDEPFKHLKTEQANQRVLNMMQEISQKLNLQIIMVSDERIPREQIMESADRVFETSISNGRTRIHDIA